MLASIFSAHGRISATRPWQVVLSTLSVIASIISVRALIPRSFGESYRCAKDEFNDMVHCDVIILTIIKCLSLLYLYLQFRKLRRLGSKYILGVAALFIIFSSVIFSSAVMYLVGTNVTGLKEALPFFLLLVDVSKAGAVARLALTSKTKADIEENIARGMAVIGPALTLDALVETLVIGVGSISGVEQIETICCFLCLSVIANFLAFITFYPACLALALDVSLGERDVHFQQLQQLGKLLPAVAEPNPVTQRVKIIMSAGLIFVHGHSRLVTRPSGLVSTSAPLLASCLAEVVPFASPQSILDRFQPYSPHIGVAFAVLLLLKFIIYDHAMTCEGLGEAWSDVTLTREESSQEGWLHEAGYVLEQLAGPSKHNSSSSSSIETAVTHEASHEKLSFFIDNGTAHTIENGIADTTGDESTGQVTTTEEDVSRCLATNSRCSTDDITENIPHPLVGISSCSETACQIEKENDVTADSAEARHDPNTSTRDIEACMQIMNSPSGCAALTDRDVVSLVRARKLASYNLETALGNHERGVTIRRMLIAEAINDAQTKSHENSQDGAAAQSAPLNRLPYRGYDYTKVWGACCENVVGYVPLPVGVAGPLLLDGQTFQIPMATTEGCLVASTNRGCRALTAAGGAHSVLLWEGMTRAPAVRFPSALRAAACKRWLELPENVGVLMTAFNSTSKFARLRNIQVAQAGRLLYIRFVATTGDAMGMNMVSKGAERVLAELHDPHFPDMEVLSISGNYCSDKKPAAVNWVEGRGKSVVCEVTVPASVVRETLKTTAAALVDLNTNKNLVGSAMAASIGGFNAHAANIVTAMFIATGQDPAQTVSSSNCITLMETCGAEGQDLYVSCTMPSLEVGTVGGGTALAPQAACLKMLGVHGPHATEPGRNAERLARIVCGAVLAGELSLMSALTSGHLVKAHLKHNRASGGTGVSSSSS